MTYYKTSKGVVFPLMFPEDKKKSTLIRLCQDAEPIAIILDYCIYGAAYEHQNRGGKPEGCKVVKITRTHDKILSALDSPPSRKTLIRYLDLLNDWGFVLSTRYHREFTVNFEAIQKAIDAPVQAGGYTKKVVVNSSTTLQPFESEALKVVVEALEKLQHYNLELEEKVVTLSKKVVDLEANVVDLSKKVEASTTLQPRFEALEKRVQGHFFDPTTSITNVLPSITSVYDGVAIADATPSPFSPELNDEIDIAVVQEWLRSRNTPTSQRVISADEDGLVQELVWQLRDRQLTMQYPLDESTLFASFTEENLPLNEENTVSVLGNAPNHGGNPFSGNAPSFSTDLGGGTPPFEQSVTSENLAPNENESQYHLSTASEQLIHTTVDNVDLSSQERAAIRPFSEQPSSTTDLPNKPRGDENGRQKGASVKDTLPADSQHNSSTNSGKQPINNSYSREDAKAPFDAQEATPQSSEPAQPSLFPVVEVPKKTRGKRAQTAKAEKPAKPEKPKEPELSEEEKAREQERLEKHRIVYANIIKRRGGELDGRKIGRERAAINKLLADGRTPERIDEHHRYHAEDDWHFNKPGDKAWITAWVIEQDWVTVEIAISDPDYQHMKQAQQQNAGKWTKAQTKVATRVISSFDDPNYDMSKEFYDSEADRRKRYAAS